MAEAEMLLEIVQHLGSPNKVLVLVVRDKD
jgi:hypothetical protein